MNLMTEAQNIEEVKVDVFESTPLKYPALIIVHNGYACTDKTFDAITTMLSTKDSEIENLGKPCYVYLTEAIGGENTKLYPLGAWKDEEISLLAQVVEVMYSNKIDVYYAKDKGDKFKEINKNKFNVNLRLEI